MTTGKYLLPLALALALSACFGSSSADAQSRFYERKAEGWFWYAQEPEPEPEPEAEEPLPEISIMVAPSPVTDEAISKDAGHIPLSTAWLKENMEQYLMTAIDNPTMENVKAYLYLQRIAIDRADRYAVATQMATLGDPLLDETVRRPLAEFAVTTVDHATTLAKNELVTSLAKKAGIFVFFTSQCTMCELQAPLLKTFSQHDGFTLIPISLDGKNLTNNPFDYFRIDDGHAEQLGVQTLPALFLVSPEGKFAPIGQGAFSLPELQQRILVAARREGWISEMEFNRTRPVMNHTNLADLLPSEGETATAFEQITKNGSSIDSRTLLEYIRGEIGALQ